ncbi:hypothetical protein EZV62_016261 [Acer yangbiense]|uniref:Retrotransposon gag domain-containing protein n=1 Tax=Acer yangbiense TaxID=1000413 RepID=A0A5C7HQD1_9ROSI|nr:hypothetical protein EZV62_016261 [Acer yangbiense]
MDVLEARMAGLEESVSGSQTTLSDVVGCLDGLEADYGEITQATKSMIREFQKGFKENICFLTQELRNLRTFVEHVLRAVHVEVEEVRTEWASYQSSQTVGVGATTSTNTNTNTIQIPKPSTYNNNRKAMEVENFLFGLEQYFEVKGFKRELKKQFSPTNAEKEACGRLRLRHLKQSGSIPDYIKEFTTLILEIEDMSGKDKLFYFMDGLKD